MPVKKGIKTHIRKYMETKTEATFKELYSAFKQFSRQHIRNTMYALEREGVVKKVKIETHGRTSKVKFKLKHR